MIEHAKLLSLLTYDPGSGVFRWAVKHNKSEPGDVAGYATWDGYVRIQLDGRGYLAHRLAWFYVNGEWPAAQVDHINCQRSDNRFENLRSATNGQNRANSRTNSRHGLKGISFDKKAKTRPWRASIGKDGRFHHLGCFSTKEEAHAAYCAKAREFHGEFARAEHLKAAP